MSSSSMTRGPCPTSLRPSSARPGLEFQPLPAQYVVGLASMTPMPHSARPGIKQRPLAAVGDLLCQYPLLGASTARPGLELQPLVDLFPHVLGAACITSLRPSSDQPGIKQRPLAGVGDLLGQYPLLGASTARPGLELQPLVDLLQHVLGAACPTSPRLPSTYRWYGASLGSANIGFFSMKAFCS
jgi:hypothetical protein